MFPWRSAWSTSAKARLPERRPPLLRAHSLGARGEAAEALTQPESLEHLRKRRARVGGDEQVRPHRVLPEVTNEPLPVRHSRVARAVAPDRVRLVRHALGDQRQVVAAAVVGRAEQESRTGEHDAAAEMGPRKPREGALVAVRETGERRLQGGLVLDGREDGEGASLQSWSWRSDTSIWYSSANRVASMSPVRSLNSRNRRRTSSPARISLALACG